MAHFMAELTDELCEFIARQPVFFVATATDSSRINLSPKGRDTLRVLDSRRVAYLDLTGSGNETAAHLAHDGRLTMMLCSFEGAPLILRLYGRGEAVEPDDAGWSELAPLFEQLPGTRQIIVLTIESLQTSCGGAVPLLEFVSPRENLVKWARSKGPEGLAEYRAKNNRQSIDGLEVPTSSRGAD